MDVADTCWYVGTESERIGLVMLAGVHVFAIA